MITAGSSGSRSAASAGVSWGGPRRAHRRPRPCHRRDPVGQLAEVALLADAELRVRRRRPGARGPCGAAAGCRAARPRPSGSRRASPAPTRSGCRPGSSPRPRARPRAPPSRPRARRSARSARRSATRAGRPRRRSRRAPSLEAGKRSITSSMKFTAASLPGASRASVRRWLVSSRESPEGLPPIRQKQIQAGVGCRPRRSPPRLRKAAEGMKRRYEEGGRRGGRAHHSEAHHAFRLSRLRGGSASAPEDPRGKGRGRWVSCQGDLAADRV